jgi:hypothetical protein
MNILELSLLFVVWLLLGGLGALIMYPPEE